jgi:magnesium-transporting ATPase (P-type)
VIDKHRLVKKGVRPKPITLAIGDGANDVSMMRCVG